MTGFEKSPTPCRISSDFTLDSEIITITPPTSRAMAQKTLRGFFAPFADNIPVGPHVNTGAKNFKIKMGLIAMVHANPFCGKANEDASTHLQQFLELYSTFFIKGVT
jgi:hypothetical protein